MKSGNVRIIAGRFRGRRLKVPMQSDLRPTPDRVRETLFNWLAPYLPGSRCLDMFAGSGVLGMEALSRGAAYVTFVDRAPEVVHLLKEELVAFGVANAEVYQANAPAQLRHAPAPYDIVFLDPPYDKDLLPACCSHLEEQHFLSADAFIYLEARDVITDNALPANWRMIKSKQAGQVAYHLAKREKKVS